MKNDPIENYLRKRADLISRQLIARDCDGLDQVVVIPVLAEQATLFSTLEGVSRNPSSDLKRTLVICVVNNRAHPHADRAMIEDNQATLRILDGFVRHKAPGGASILAKSALRLGYIDASSPGCELPPKDGVGLARKLGLDWGLEVVRKAGSPTRLLLSLDADTRVEPNYLGAVRRFFEANNTWAAVIDYAHRLEGPREQQAGIICYELFLRCHVMGLRHAKSPYAFPSIGSTMVCRAEAYAAVSGMNRRQAGEDFYFLQQLAKTGGVARVHTTTVHPASRPGRRTPFGTGQRVRRFMEGFQDEYRAYHPDSYAVLRDWLELVAARPDSDAETLENEAGRICSALRTFLELKRFGRAWERIQKNSADPRRLLEQFHRWFDGLKTVRLIHHLRDNGFPDQDLFCSIDRLLAMSGEDPFPVDMTHIHHDLDAQKELLAHLRAKAPAP